MTDPRPAVSRLLGEVEWTTPVHGFCRCPGESYHTHRTGKKDCRVMVDGAPTIYCFHSSCQAAVAEANHRLRRELGSHDWRIIIPGGGELRPGDILQPTGEVQPREVIQAGKTGDAAAEATLIATLTTLAERFRPQLFERFRWPFAKILEDSPLLVADRGAEEQFRTWLRIWPQDCTVWIGDVFSSGRPEHSAHFRPIKDWYAVGPVMGNYTCGASFKPGSWQRSNANIGGHRFLVVESDTLAKDEVGAVFKYLSVRLQYNLHCIVDTAGKSLHGWFDCPPTKLMESRLKAGLTAFGCDPKMFTYSQPVRVPGALRDDRLQRLIWLKD